MSLNVWIEPSGFSFGTIQEDTAVSLPLPLTLVGAFNGIAPPSFDGRGHHPTAPLRNTAGAPFTRNAINSYLDGIHQMRTDLPNARTVSNLIVWDKVAQGDQPDPNGYSGFMYAFGQFLTHDLEFARPGTGNIDVIVPANDTILTPGNHIPVTRNAVAPNTGTDAQHPALPLNDVTGWIDASVVYGIAYPPGVPQGPTPFANPVNLREGGIVATTGKLLTTNDGKYGPIVNNNFVFGDPRGTENPDLTSVQTLFIREHNWHIDRLKELHPTWTGEQLYQRARNIVIAEIQNITYNEWLPKVVGSNALPAYKGFKPDVDATVNIEFAAAAMRFGHSIVSGAQDRVDEAGNVTESLTLAQAFFLTPALFERNGGADGFLRKLASDISNKLDVHIIEDLRNLLNDPPASIDLAATNIQRGRDLGLPSLNQMRIALGLSPYTSFDQITSDTVVSAGLQTAYVDIDKIDLWIGGLAETPVAGAMVGQTFRTIIIDQFIRTRDGDQQWFENQPWAPADLAWLKASTLSDIILRNTNTIHMQSDAFVAVARSALINNEVASISPRTTGVTMSAVNDVTFKLISGKLPPGLRVSGPFIVGTPTQVSKLTTFTFCIRATYNSQIADRTFNITVDGADAPVFITPPGELAIGMHEQLYVLDRTYLDFQIEAYDIDTAVGQRLSFFIASGDGELPPGVTLSDTGRIQGFVRPTFKVLPIDGNGNYDVPFYDAVAYDFSIRPTNGFDSYLYDNVKYDYSQPSTIPVSLNRNYEFIVTLTDGTTYIQRKYRIFVVGDDSFRADSTLSDAIAQQFTADATYLRQPAWLTNSTLGSYRANNYITMPFKLYDDTDVIMRLEATNQEIYASTLQIGPTDNRIDFNTLTIANASSTPLRGQYLTFDNYLDGADGTIYQIQSVTGLGVKQYRLTLNTRLKLIIPDGISFYIGSISQLPPGVAFDVNTSRIYGVIPYQPAITKTYKFTLTATRLGIKGDTLNSFRTFLLDVIGEIDSVITWNSSSYLGSIDANYNSTFAVQAQSNLPNATILYTLLDDTQRLPPGLTLNLDGEILGSVDQNQIAIFDGGDLIFDRGNTTFDRVYTFIVQARDQFNFSLINKSFTIAVRLVDTVPYSNIKVKPLLKLDQRETWKSFINNADVFTPNSIYRPNDINFGVQSSLSMIVYAGIETKEAAAYVGAIGLNHKRKRFTFGDIKKAVAITTGTKNAVYEVIYATMHDSAEPNGKHVQLSINNTGIDSKIITVDTSNNIWSNLHLGDVAPYLDRPDFNITVDSSGYEVSDPNVNKYFPNSISNWQSRLSTVGLSERNYLPLWMRSIQPGTKQELGYQLAVPICFCKPGTADDILLNIKNYIKTTGFSLNKIDYTVDRYIIDSVTGYTSDKYLIFRNDRITV